MKLKCSIIIPHYNQLNHLTICLESLSKQSIPREQYEIIVVDNGSSQSIPLYIKEIVDQWIVINEPKNPYTCRNAGIEIAQTGLILFTDSKCIPTNDWVEVYLNQFDHENIMVQAGPIVVPDTTSITSLFYYITCLDVEQLVIHKQGILGGNLAVRQRVFKEIGGFPDVHRSGGDVLWGQRVFRNSITVHYNNAAKVSITPKNNIEIKSSHLRFGSGAVAQYKNIGKPWYFHIKMIVYHLLPDSPHRIKRRFSQKNLPVQHLCQIWWITWYTNLIFGFGYMKGLLRLP